MGLVYYIKFLDLETTACFFVKQTVIDRFNSSNPTSSNIFIVMSNMMDSPSNEKSPHVQTSSDFPEGIPCKPHGNKSELVCENTLPSGLSCPYSVCDECWDYNEGNEDILPKRTSIFCFDCINALKAKYRHEVIPSLTELANVNQSRASAPNVRSLGCCTSRGRR